jgi:16S rRNA processing protein RimM
MKRICLGKIVATHGLKGLVKILPYGENPELIETGGPAFTSESGTETLEISFKNQTGKYLLAAVKGVSDRTGAEALRGTELYIDKNKLPEIIDADTYYYADLIGLKAVDEAGKAIGKVIDVQNFGAGDLLEIQPLQGESYYLPFTKEFAPRVDLANKTMTVKPMESDEE